MQLGAFSFSRYIWHMQINFEKKSELLLGIIAGLLVIIIVLVVDKVEDDENMVETHSAVALN
ncbi:unannotated protein [freshwater metagenome]|uniref:Unannotated protein n=1 Tax=freshwater metagenome TaxID=449393 RepID=A0A6J6LN65_9ZZZZ